MESEHGSGSSRDVKSHLEAMVGEGDLPMTGDLEATVGEGDLPTPGEKSSPPSPTSSSSSSSDSSLEDFLHLDTSEHSKSTTGTTGSPQPDEDAQLNSEYVEGDKYVVEDIPSDSSLTSGESDQGSPGPIPLLEVSDLTLESSLNDASARQSPPIQVMSRSEDANSYRIPSSVFARSKSTTPMEWSVASNESLFSIHVGNNSFSRDHIFLMGRSGELGKSGELINFPDFSASPPSDNVVASTARKSTDLGEDLGVIEAAAETMKEVLRAVAEDHSKEKITCADGLRQSSSHSHHSDGSGASVRSFAFPIKKRCAWLFCNGTWPLCYCCNGSRTFCNCTWPLCYCCSGSRAFCNCTWPHCYCCNGSRACCHCTWPLCYCCNGSWACCHCSNCSGISICSFISTILAGEGGVRSGSVKVDSEQPLQQQPEPQPQTPSATLCAVWIKWFSCFSCRPFCC